MPTPAPPRPRAGPPLETILDAVGGTPIVRLSRVVPPEAAEVLAKLESFNPGGSVKDRIAVAMIEAAEREGRLAPGARVVEPTSGNTGLGLALACAVKGYRLTLVMPDSTSLEHRQALEAYGAALVLTPAEDGMTPAVARADELARREGALLLQQFENPANPAAHRQGTARELVAAFDALGAPMDAFVAGVGTGGTITGVADVLRQERPGTLIVAVEPDACAVLSGGPAGPTRIQGLGAGFVPAVLDARAYDRVERVADEEAWAMKLRLARDEGLLVGTSSGAAVVAALRVARELGPGRRVATILPDSGERYFSMAEWFPREVTP
ncbi:cysteine synthase A [Anaeromyxobacter sp. Fw109-5]|uniref:cysteine synthase A n=1 Tax=Anaeromyxobacter sp. (strain Fw109-5) TaxID=404589 RepID=UPI0000ED714F|nr:cysteine synthase A [Anaeromyxobacter sp. Fw109-5]ABS27789.1 cysteine synthase [Anaeromyxobacter sp. Fw109-5]